MGGLAIKRGATSLGVMNRFWMKPLAMIENLVALANLSGARIEGQTFVGQPVVSPSKIEVGQTGFARDVR